MNSSYVDMSGKVVLITGGSRGLGLSMAHAFAENGATVIVSSRKQDACDLAVEEIQAKGGRAIGIACHVGDWEALPNLVQAVLDQCGKIDVLINNAGLGPATESSLDMSEALFNKILDVNLKGPFRLSALVAQHMKAQGSGAIINISSTGSLRPEPPFNVYAAAKGGLNIITRSQAQEFGPEVRVNAIMAGPFWTDMSASWREELDSNSPSAMGRIGRPHEIVSTALYFASSASSFTTGAVIPVDGGLL